MKKITLTIIIFMLLTTLVFAQDPGIRDTIKIESVYITPPADSIVVGISLFTDNLDSIIFYSMPLVIPSTSDGINFERVEYYYPMSAWEFSAFEYDEDEGFLAMHGWTEPGSVIPPWPGPPRYYHFWDLVFSVEPGAENQILFINEYYDNTMGPLFFGLSGYLEYQPFVIEGVVFYENVMSIDQGDVTPNIISISNCYPNPFNTSTTIEFSLSESSNVRIEIYDILGQKITVLLKGQLEAGQYRETWDASGIKSGMYFMRLSTEKYSDTKKLILLK